MDKRKLVAVVDDDESVRESLPDLLGELGFTVKAFNSGESFLASEFVRQTECLLLDIAMPGMSGFDVQQELKVRRHKIPIVFITGHKVETPGPGVLDESALAYLLKPFSDTALLQAIRTALGIK